MPTTLRNLWHFLIGFVLWLAFGGAMVWFFERDQLHISLNHWHQPLADVFFRYITHLGDGLFGVLVVLLGFIYKIRYGVISALGLIGSGVITQVLKRQVFNDHFRPSAALGHIADLHFVEGVTLHSNFSFPSGHATTAFAVFIFLAMLSKRGWIQVICLISAVVVAYSRVYISQHFFEDIYLGSIIGTSAMLLAYHLLNEKKWGEKGLIGLIDQHDQ